MDSFNKSEFEKNEFHLKYREAVTTQAIKTSVLSRAIHVDPSPNFTSYLVKSVE